MGKTLENLYLAQSSQYFSRSATSAIQHCSMKEDLTTTTYRKCRIYIRSISQSATRRMHYLLKKTTSHSSINIHPKRKQKKLVMRPERFVTPEKEMIKQIRSNVSTADTSAILDAKNRRKPGIIFKHFRKDRCCRNFTTYNLPLTLIML